ncbi:MAG: dUTP diphosphatase [Vicinamibacteraceae bacterium]
MDLRIRRLSPDAVLPSAAHPGDAGLDLHAASALTIAPGAWAVVPTGITIELPPGTEAQVRPRSGLAARYGVTVLNAPGTIDEGYRGEVGVILINHGPAPFEVTPGARVAQLVVKQRLEIRVVEVDDLSATARGVGGFGSTGA